jgi:hypothetical protein
VQHSCGTRGPAQQPSEGWRMSRPLGGVPAERVPAEGGMVKVDPCGAAARKDEEPGPTFRTPGTVSLKRTKHQSARWSLSTGAQASSRSVANSTASVSSTGDCREPSRHRTHPRGYTTRPWPGATVHAPETCTAARHRTTTAPNGGPSSSSPSRRGAGACRRWGRGVGLQPATWEVP